MDNSNRPFAPSLFRGEQWIEEPSYEAAVLSSKNSPQMSEFAPSYGDSQRVRRKYVEQNEELPMICTSTLHSTGDTFTGSLQSLSSTSMHSSSGRVTGSSDPYNSTGRSTLRLSFEEEPCLPNIRSEYGEVDPIERSLRLLKSPHLRQLPSEHDVLESPLTSKGYRHSYPIEEDQDTYLYRQARHSAPAHRRAISYDPEPAQGAHAYDTGPPHTQPTGFDTASKARLRRSRLKSADAAASKSYYNSSQDASSDADGTYLMGKLLQPKPLTGRTIASRSDNGLDKFALALPHDERPVGGSSSSGARGMGAYSQDQDYPDQQEEYEAMAPSPARRHPSGGRRIRAHSDAPPPQASALKLNEVTSLIGKPDTTYDYIPSEDITPCVAPAQDMAKAYKGLDTQEWPEIFHTLNTFRKLALHHPNILLSSGNLHNLILLIMKRVDALRSSLAKNALLTLQDLLHGLKKNLDSEVAAIMPGILKRAIDSSSFLVESADSALQTIIEQTSLVRSLGSVLLHVTHRSAVLRSKVAMCLYAMVVAKGDEFPLCKEFDGFKSCLPKLLQDAAPDTRAYSRETVRLLLQRQLTSRGELESPVGADLLEKILREASIAHTLSPTVNGRVTAAPRTAGSDYGSFSPARPARNGRHTPVRDAAAAGPFTPTRERAHSDWSATVDGGTPTPSKNRAQCATQLRLQNPSNRIKASMHSQNHLEAEEQHDYQHLAQSAEQLSAQLDSQLASPARPTPPSARGAAPSTQSRPSKVATNSTDEPPAKGGGGGAAAKIPAASQAASALAAAAKRAMDQDPELSCLQEILAGTAVSSWTERKTALDRVTEMVVRHYDVLKDANKLGACVDSLLARLEDGSVKVHMHTLECLERIYSEEPLVLQHNLLQIVVPAVLGSVASTNKLISGKSVVMLRLLFDTLSPQQVAQYLCQTALHEKDKLRLTSLRFLADVMPVFCCDHDSITCIAKKILFPMLCKLLFTATTKGDLRVNGAECARSLQSSLPAQKIWLWADDPQQQEELKRITNV